MAGRYGPRIRICISLCSVAVKRSVYKIDGQINFTDIDGSRVQATLDRSPTHPSTVFKGASDLGANRHA